MAAWPWWVVAGVFLRIVDRENVGGAINACGVILVEVYLMLSRRRSASAKKKTFPANVVAGISSLVRGNESVVASMLEKSDEVTGHALVECLTDCMGVNNLSAEMLLARFFDSSVLSNYCISVLNKSGKGSVATLSERIAREWAKPTFGEGNRDDTIAHSRKISPPRRQLSNTEGTSDHRDKEKKARKKLKSDGMVSVNTLSKSVKSLARLSKLIREDRSVEDNSRIESVLEHLRMFETILVTRELVLESGLGKVIGKISKRSKVKEIKKAATALKNKFITQLDECESQ